MTDRTQTVKIFNLNSDSCNIKVGVPQGSILGPLLFIIYINDLLSLLPDGCIVSYADDTVILSSGKTWEIALNNMRMYLKKVCDWLKLNKLSINLTKTVYITFGIYITSIPQNVSINIDNIELNNVESTKYLGVYFDRHMR